RSGRKYNKWEKMNLTPAPARVVKAPVIKESPVNIECRVINILELGSHHAFISEVVGVSVDEEYLNDNNAFSFSGAKPLVYSHGHYFGLGKMIGKFGWSVQKKKKKKKY
ncbi:MAG: flavin reductase family protein, partial [Bacteroidales bacterium]|nr:flavin reductase family protein [Bacteroidales bacterium]